jgi:hypothetical protein
MCRWYALVEGNKFVPNIKISRNQQISCIHVKNATAWVANTKHKIVRRDTLLFDYIYFVHPTAIGHWYVARAFCECAFVFTDACRPVTAYVHEGLLYLQLLRKEQIHAYSQHCQLFSFKLTSAPTKV